MHTDAMRRRWQNSRYKEHMANMVREYWDNASFEDFRKEFLPSYSGFRRDVGFNAKSCWEANLARVLLYCERKFDIDVPLELEIPEELRYLFRDGKAILFIDFISTTKDGRIRAYEISAHSFENPKGRAKLELLSQQYPELNIQGVDKHFYRRLEKTFKDKINADSRFVAWEDSRYNIRTNPQNFA